MKRTFAIFLTGLLALFCWQTAALAQAPSIQEGTILHCFNWKYSDIEAELQNIANAGFTAIQTSPAQSNYTGTTGWNTLYRPRDTEIGPNTLGNKSQLKRLCDAAHALGLKVIVDVVANHTDGTLAWVADYWKNTDLYHNMGPVSNWNDRYQVTHGSIGMMDLKTEDSRVYSKFKTYIQALKSIGVDGCRFDAAKHIGLPSEGDSFWLNVIDPTMYNYGEILYNTGGDDSRLLPEYMQYMSVTDAGYSTGSLLSEAKNGRATTSAGNYSFTYNTSKLVYWGECHDTYCNDGDASDGVDQAVVDRAYAIAASHNQIPALYFSRPLVRGSQSQAGEKGSTHFKDKAVAEVNKFHNAMNGKADYYTGNGSVASVTRQNGGAIVVNFGGAGSVTVANGGGYAAPGTYTDRVSGSQWTITATTISGQTDGTGIAVLYDDSQSGGGGGAQPGNVLPDCVKPEPDGTIYAYFAAPDTWASPVNVWAWNSTVSSWYGDEWPGTASQIDIKVVGTTDDGLTVYEWIYRGNNGQPDQIIFNDGTNQTMPDFVFVNGGYYTVGGLVKSVTAIDRVVTTGGSASDNAWYTLTGACMASKPTAPGIYIHQGRKFIVK